MRPLWALLLAGLGLGPEKVHAEEQDLFPLQLRAQVGTAFTYWIPKPIEGATLKTQGYEMLYADLSLSLFDRLNLYRVRFESSLNGLDVPANPSTPDIDADTAALLFQLGSGIVVYKGIGPAFFYTNDRYVGSLTADKDLAYVNQFHRRDDGESVLSKGQELRFLTEFEQYFVGLGGADERLNSTEGGTGLVFVGGSYLEFTKPWSIDKLKTNHVFYSQFTGYAFSGMLDARDDRGFRLNVEGHWGWGDVQVYEDASLGDILEEANERHGPGGSLQVNFLMFTAAGQVRFSIAETNLMRLSTTVGAGFSWDYFWVGDGDNEGDDDVTLTWDIHLLAMGMLEFELAERASRPEQDENISSRP